MDRIPLIFAGSGAFGAPTLQALAKEHDVRMVVCQPDKPAGRRRAMTATPIGALAERLGIATIKPESINEPDVVKTLDACEAGVMVVIAYGQKLGPAVIGDRLAINLHASLLPKYRGAAPINWAMIHGETTTGVSVITLAQRMDAGDVLGQASLAIAPMETAGELHDRLAGLGPELVLDVLDRHLHGRLDPISQDESLVCQAPKLSKHDGTVDFNMPASQIRARIHGLTPWPGCTVHLERSPLKLLRAEAVASDTPERLPRSIPGTLDDDLTIVCASGALRLLSVQPPGGKAMSFEAYCRGHSVQPGDRITARTDVAR